MGTSLIDGVGPGDRDDRVATGKENESLNT